MKAVLPLSVSTGTYTSRSDAIHRPLRHSAAPTTAKMRSINTEIINTTKQVADLVDWLVLRHEGWQFSPTMYIDLEGVDLCREGSISILTLLIDTGIPTGCVCLVDVHTLGAEAFNTPSLKAKTLGKTLKGILEDEKIAKVFFDVRNDSDALFAHYGVALQGVADVQLMESATRRTTEARKYVSGLAKCIEQNVVWPLTFGNLASWKLAKEKGERLFKSEHGGSYDVFNLRPIPADIVAYCVGDVQCLPHLREKFAMGTNRWQDLVNEETKKRVAVSQRPEYQPRGPDRALAPWSGDQNRTLDEWNYVPPSRDYFDDDVDLYEDFYEEEWYDDRGDNDYEDWTRADWQGPPS